MKELIRRLFTVPPGPRTRWRVIVWWELRRIPYNFILATTGLVNLAVFSLLVDGVFDFVTPMIGVFVFAFGANVCYTGGWLVEGSLHLTSKGRTDEFAARAFRNGLLFSMSLTFIPTLAAAAFAVTGNRLQSPYSQFTTAKPEINELQGTYHLNNSHNKFNLTPFPGIEYHPKLELLANGEALFEDFPLFEEGGAISIAFVSREWENVSLLSGRATWSLEKGNLTEACWSVEFKIIGYDSDENDRNLNIVAHNSTIFLQGSSAPYRLYRIVGDPDSWSGFHFERTPGLH